MSDAQKHPPQARVRGRVAPTPAKPSALASELRVLELEAEVARLEKSLALALREAVRLRDSMRDGGVATTRYQEEQRKHLHDAERQLVHHPD